MRVFALHFLAAAISLARGPSRELQVTEALLTEIRQLRQDLQATAATIQRVQLVMFRMQVAASTLTRATQRLDETRNRCNQIPVQRKAMTAQLENAENRQRNVQNAPDSRIGDEVARLKGSLEMVALQEQQCQTTIVDAEVNLRAEQAKMNDLQDQFDKLDRALADGGRK